MMMKDTAMTIKLFAFPNEFRVFMDMEKGLQRFPSIIYSKILEDLIAMGAGRVKNNTYVACFLMINWIPSASRLFAVELYSMGMRAYITQKLFSYLVSWNTS